MRIRAHEDGRPVEEDGVGEGREAVRVAHLVVEDGLVAERVGAVVGGAVVGARAPLGSVVAPRARVVDARHALVQVARRLVGVDVAGEADRGRRRRGRVRDKPVGADERAEDADDRLNDVGERDREESARDRVHVEDHAADEDRGGLFDAAEVAEDGRHAHQVAREQRDEGGAADERDDHLDDRAVVARIDVRHGEHVLAVDEAGGEDAVDDEREAEPDRQHRPVPEVVLVGQVDVAEQRV